MAETLPRDLHRFVELLASSWGDNLVSVVLFGSCARGTATPDSDIDLLIVAADLPNDRLERFRLWWPVARQHFPELARKLSVILLTVAEARTTRPFYLDLVEEGVLLHDRDGFFRKALDRLRERLARLGAKRLRDPQGRPYWVLKETCAFGEPIEL
jgi:predicted nucleotidyltransferase